MFTLENNCVFFKKVFMNIKNLVTDINLNFDNDGLKIFEYNTKNTLSLQIFFNRYFFNKYNFDHKISLSLNLIEFYTCLKSLREDSIFTLKIDKNNNFDVIHIQIKNDYKITNFYIQTYTNKKIFEDKIFNILYNHKFNYYHKNLIKNLISMSSITNTVNMKIKNNILFLEGKDDFTSQITEIKMDSINSLKNNNNINLDNFIIKELIYIINSCRIFDNNEFHIEKNKPLLFYNYSENVYFKIYIIPIQYSHY